MSKHLNSHTCVPNGTLKTWTRRLRSLVRRFLKMHGWEETLREGEERHNNGRVQQRDERLQ